MIWRFFLLISFILLSSFKSYSQDNYKYNVSVYAGWLTLIANRGSKGVTDVAEVSFIRPVTKTLGSSFEIDIYRSFFVGIEFSYDEFDYGYEAHQSNTKNSSVGISSGLLAANDRVAIYKAGLRLGYHRPLSKRMELNSFLIPSIGYYKFSNRLNDTLEANASEWRDYNESQVLYIAYPPLQRQGLNLLLRGSLEIVYYTGKNRKLGFSFMFSYQQGFRWFVWDKVNIIRPHEPSGLKESLYWTKVSGSSFQWHLGLRYQFN